MSIQEIPSTRPFFSPEDIAGIQKDIGNILTTGRLILGPYTKSFEESFSKYIGVKHAIAVSSCTAALEIVLRFFKLNRGEVIVPTNTFIATGNAVIYAGGSLILSDINKDTLCLDIKDAEKRITSHTKGIIAVHIAGLISPDIEQLRHLCKERGLFLIEDAAHAAGASSNGVKAGSIGDAGCFSFYPTKVMTTCVGGMITTNLDRLAEYAVSLRHHGIGRDLNNIVNMGNDWMMDEIRAVLGLSQLKHLDDYIRRRNHIAKIYNEKLAKLDYIKTFLVPEGSCHSYYKYPALLSPEIDKIKLTDVMAKKYKISLGSVYDPPMHLHPVYRELFKFKPGDFPSAQSVLARTVCLPIFVQMTESEVEYVIKSLKKELLYLL